MLTATKTVLTVELQCPDCANTHESASGLYWTREEIELASKVQKCVHCGLKFKLPRI